MTSPASPTLSDIAVSRSEGLCVLTWSDGRVDKLTLTTLRVECPCATCRDVREKRAASPLVVISGPPPSAELLAVEPVGGYAIRFQWADGHSSGIYSYSFLRDLADQLGEDDADSPAD
ncbi:MAG TPA: hypothetical protein DCZ72_05460 [Armatimonadetes bacterium]|nr:hypothetical protein [Armatimonadota bacterium]